MKMRLFLMLVMLYISWCEAKSISKMRKEKTSGTRGARRGGGKVWSPKSQDVSRDDWVRCRGIPCAEWEKRQLKLMQLNTFYPKTDKNRNKVFEFPESIGHEGIQSLDLDGEAGCIWLTSEQIDDIVQEELNSSLIANDRSKKFDAFSLNYQWDMPIRYFFDGKHNRLEKNMVRAAAKHWEDHTCVRFKEISQNDYYNSNHLVFTGDNTGCHSWVGKMYSYPQQINLQSACFGQFGIPVHEIGHALGLWHEQQRSDRDDHININYSNLGAYYSQFTKKYTKSLGVEYDIGSVMHYAPKDGSSNGQNVMNTKDPLYQGNMGQRTGLSYNDAKIINFAYCADFCKKSLPQSCQRGGYQDPNNCNQCRCPPGFGGQYCENVAKSRFNCGGEIQVTSAYTYIESPSYANGNGEYEDKTECNWLIKAPSNHKVVMSFEGTFAVFCRISECFHWVEVKYKGKLDKQGPRFCCRKTPNTVLQSDSEEMAIIFRSDYTTYWKGDRIGFRIKLHATPSGIPAMPPLGNHHSTTVSSTTTSTTTQPTTRTTKRTTVTTQKPTTTTTDEIVNAELECIQVDLSFLLDSSGSVQEANWNLMEQFLSKIINRLTISDQCAKIGVISFGNQAEIEIPFNYAGSKSDMISKIFSMEFKNQWTNTAGALDLLIKSLYKGVNGARRSVANVTVLITDGNGNTGRNPVDAANDVHNNYIHILGVGVSSLVDKRELEVIAKGTSNVKYIYSFDEMITEAFIQDMMKRIKDAMPAPVNKPNIDNSSTTKQSTSSTRKTTQYKSSTTTSSTTTTTQSTWQKPPTSSFEFECSFEGKSLCGMTQSSNDDFDWTIQKGKTPSDPTGPDSAYEGDYYIYIEASQRRNGDKARIELPSVTADRNYCLTFWYHMYGFHIKTLTVYRLNKYNRLKQIWRKNGERGDTWIQGSLNTQLVTGEKIVFEAVRGGEYSGDIGLDKIKLSQC